MVRVVAVRVAAAVVEAGAESGRGVGEVPAVDQRTVVRKANHRGMHGEVLVTAGVGVVLRGVQALPGRRRERVAVQVRLPAALADVLVARVHLARLQRDLQRVGVQGVDALPGDADSDAGVRGQGVGVRAVVEVSPGVSLPGGLCTLGLAGGERALIEVLFVLEVIVRGPEFVHGFQRKRLRLQARHRGGDLAGDTGRAVRGGAARSLGDVVHVRRPARLHRGLQHQVAIGAVRGDHASFPVATDVDVRREPRARALRVGGVLRAGLRLDFGELGGDVHVRHRGVIALGETADVRAVRRAAHHRRGIGARGGVDGVALVRGIGGKRERACVSIRAFRVGRNEGDPTATREGRVEGRVERDFERRDGLCAVRTTSSRDASPCAAVATNDDVGRFPRTEKRAR